MRGCAIRSLPGLLFIGTFFIVPLGLLIAYSVATSTFVSLEFGFSLDAYQEVFSSEAFRRVYVQTLWIGFTVAILAVVIAYPFAYIITVGSLRRHGGLLLAIVLISLFSAYIVRVYAWRALLGRNGAVNEVLDALGLIDRPLEILLYSKLSLLITYVNILVPLALLPLYAAFIGLDRSLIEAARTLGASSHQILRRVVAPLTSRGILAAFALCFVAAAGDYVTPQLVGGPSGVFVGNLVTGRFGVAYDWPVGAALALILVIALGIVIGGTVLLLRRLGLKDQPS